MTEAYRVTLEKTWTLGQRTWTKRRVVPLATKQRLGCIIAYQRELPPADRWSLKVERAELGEFAPAEGLKLPVPHAPECDLVAFEESCTCGAA